MVYNVLTPQISKSVMLTAVPDYPAATGLA